MTIRLIAHTRLACSRWPALFAVAAITLQIAPPTIAAEPAGLRAYIDAVARSLPPEAANTLKRAAGIERQMLALRAYLRAGPSLESRWSWSREQIVRYEQSDEHRDAVVHLERITRRFEADNPGYTLYVNTRVRSLETQVERWNSNDSVDRAAKALRDDVTRELRDNSYPRAPSAQARKRFADLLTQWQPPEPVNLAAPGLSPHGQARAFDFQIQENDHIVAGTEAADVANAWDAEGWTYKLSAAVTAASDKFHGPLDSPREPWHYEYHP